MTFSLPVVTVWVCPVCSRATMTRDARCSGSVSDGRYHEVVRMVPFSYAAMRAEA